MDQKQEYESLCIFPLGLNYALTMSTVVFLFLYIAINLFVDTHQNLMLPFLSGLVFITCCYFFRLTHGVWVDSKGIRGPVHILPLVSLGQRRVNWEDVKSVEDDWFMHMHFLVLKDQEGETLLIIPHNINGASYLAHYINQFAPADCSLSIYIKETPEFFDFLPELFEGQENIFKDEVEEENNDSDDIDKAA